MMPGHVFIPTKPFELPDLRDLDGDTRIWLEKTADDDTIRFDLGGASPISDALTITATSGLVWNDGGLTALDFRIESDTYTHLFFADASADKIGINNNAPQRTLDIAGDFRTIKDDDSATFVFGRTGPDPVMTGSTYIPTSGAVDAVKIEPGGGFWAGSTTAGRYVIGLTIVSQHNSGSHSQPHHGINVSVRTAGSSTKTGTFNNRMAGLVFNTLHNATGTCDEIGGCVGQVGVGGVGSSVNVGTITTAFGFQAGIIFQTSGTAAVTNAYGIRVVTPSGTDATRTATNMYGLRIEDQVATGITNAWAIKTGTGKVEFDDEVWCDSTLNLATELVAASENTDNNNVIYRVTTASSAITLTLDSDDCTNGKIIVVKDIDGNASVNNITIDTEGAETIDGAASEVISDDYGWRMFFSDGSSWFIIG